MNFQCARRKITIAVALSECVRGKREREKLSSGGEEFAVGGLFNRTRTRTHSTPEGKGVQ